MNKRARASKYVFFGVLLVVILAIPIVGFIVSAYSLVFGTLLFSLYAPLLFFLYGGYLLFTGFKQMKKAKAQGEHVPWWKQPSVMSGSAYEGIAAILLSVKLNPTWITNVYFISAYVLMALLFVGLS